MATKKIKRFQEGGMSDKDRGLEASKDEKVGFFERLRMGNIDDEGSEAYRRFGAGRGKAERTPVEDRVATPVVREAAAAPKVEMDEMEAANARPPIPVPAGPRADMKPGGRPHVNVQPPRSSGKKEMTTSEAKKQLNLGDRPSSASVAKANAQLGMSESDRNENYGNEGRGKAPKASLASQIPSSSNARPVAGEKVEPMSDTERNVKNALAATGIGGGVAGLLKLNQMSKARKLAAQGAKKRANLKRDVEEGIDRNLADEFKSYSSSAAEKSIAAKQSAADRTRDLAAGQAKTKFTSESKKPSKKTKKFDDSESSTEFKRGGKAYASGGSVSAASKRADGIAARGKTRCKIC